jgi:hypothetical protein
MRVFPMINTTTTETYIAQLATSPFRWGWDFNHWVPWMLHYPLRPSRKICCMLQLELTNPPGSLSRSNTSSNRFRIFYRSPMPSTRNTLINKGATPVSSGRKILVALAERMPYKASSEASSTPLCTLHHH